MMVEKISFVELEVLINNIITYLQTNNHKLLSQIQPAILKAKALDYSIQTYDDFKKTSYDSHSPGRLGMFLLNHFGENVFADRKILICQDDPISINPRCIHDNEYLLRLHSLTPEYLNPGTPSIYEQVQDYDGDFITQYTTYLDTNTKVNTTETHFESFPVPKGINRYEVPIKRTFDFKSAFWGGKNHTHNVDYILSIAADGAITVKATTDNKLIDKDFALSEATQEQQENFNKYMSLLLKINLLNMVSWDNLILSNTQED